MDEVEVEAEAVAAAVEGGHDEVACITQQRFARFYEDFFGKVSSRITTALDVDWGGGFAKKFERGRQAESESQLASHCESSSLRLVVVCVCVCRFIFFVHPDCCFSVQFAAARPPPSTVMTRWQSLRLSRSPPSRSRSHAASSAL